MANLEATDNSRSYSPHANSTLAADIWSSAVATRLTKASGTAVGEEAALVITPLFKHSSAEGDKHDTHGSMAIDLHKHVHGFHTEHSQDKYDAIAEAREAANWKSAPHPTITVRKGDTYSKVARRQLDAFCRNNADDIKKETDELRLLNDNQTLHTGMKIKGL